MHSTPSRLAPFVFAAAFPLFVAAVFLPTEFTHYKRWLELGADETALRVAVLFFIGSKSLLAVVFGTSLVAVCARIVPPWTVRTLSLVLGFLVFGFLALDLEVQIHTGNNIANYLPFLSDPDFSVWAGRGLDVVPSLVRVARKMALLFAAAFGLAWWFERWVAHAVAQRGRWALLGLAFFALTPLLVAPVLARSVGAPGVLYHLGERMPWSWELGLGDRQASIGPIQAKAQDIYDRALPTPEKSNGRGALLGQDRPKTRPNILLVVVESLRFDALDPVTMPRVWALSERGHRLDQHYATSNASHYGLFALLFGRSPLFYFETLEAGEAPTLPSQLRHWGYTTHYLSCTKLRWREMDRFMGPPHFSVERSRGNSLEDCDREVTSRATELLESDPDTPRFVLAFLMSTHFGYHYPAGTGPFEPAISAPNALAMNADRDRDALMNRYRNSAHYVDSLIGSLLDQIDLDETLVIVTGDHGESLFDDGTVAHSSLLSRIQTRVPFAISGPRVQTLEAAAGPTDHSDVMPTLFRRLGVDSEHLQGVPGRDLLSPRRRDFVSLVHAKARADGEDQLALVSPTQGFSIRLDRSRGRVLFLGKLTLDGRPSRETVSAAEGDTALEWLEQYLNSLATD